LGATDYTISGVAIFVKVLGELCGFAWRWEVRGRMREESEKYDERRGDLGLD
jgi:hypothetical protein